MKYLTICLFLIGIVGFGLLYSDERQHALEAQANVASLKQSVAELEARLEEQQRRTTNLQTRLQNTRDKATARAEQVVQLQEALTNTVATNAKASSPMAEMFKNPEMRELIKSQQKMALNGIIEKNYAAFSAGLNLTPEQKATFKDYVLKKSLVDAQTGVSLMTGDMSTQQRTELMQKAKADKDEIDQQIKQFLGDDNFAQYQAYEKTVPQRMGLNTFKDQQASGPDALSSDQESQLLQAVLDQTHSFKFSTDYSDQAKLLADPASFFTDEKIAQFEQEQAQLLDLYLQRATNILSPGQLEPFASFLKTERSMQDTRMKMAAKLFGAKPQ